MPAADVGTRFWLRYVESQGGLWEDAGDSTLVMLPEALQAKYRQLDELRVTSDPDVAREDGATLLVAGHPWLAHAAEAVLDDGDCALVRLSRPANPPPGTDQLLAVARDQFPVDHGRLDAAGDAIPGVRLVVRLGALVTFSVSSDVSFQEQVECWVDAVSRLELPVPVVARLAGLVELERTDDTMSVPSTDQLLAALRCAYQRIDERAAEREAELAGQVAGEQRRDVARAETYYEEALRSVQRRLDTAPPDRAEMLSAKIASIRAERDRRLAEIAEKYRATHTIRPYRLHALGVPVLRLPVDVRRGERRFPLTLDWLLSARTFARVRCPACHSTAPLVVAKTGLGCHDCLVRAERPAVPRSVPPPAPSDRPPDPVLSPPPAAAPSPEPAREVWRRPQPPTPTPARTSRAVHKAGRKLVASFWDLVVAADRRVQRLYAPDSPASALHRLFGTAGPLRVLGLDGDEALSVTSSDSMPARIGGDTMLVDGALHSATSLYGYQLCWRFAGTTALIEELTPFARSYWPRQPEPRYYLAGLPFRRLHATAPSPRIDLDPVADTVWRRSVPAHGLPLALRCLAAWWRLGDHDWLLAAHRPDAVAAAIDRAVSYRAGVGGRYDEVAALFEVAAGAVRAAAADLQRRLRLSEDRPW